MGLHHLEETKRLRIGTILSMIQKAGEADVRKIKELCFDKFAMSPSLTLKYLNELQEVNKIKIHPTGDTCEAVVGVDK